MRVKYIFPILFVANIAWAQIRGTEPRNPSIQEATMKPLSGDLFLGLFDPERFQMHHAVSMSYVTMGGQSIGLSMYTNSMRYQISGPLSVRADVSMVFSPFSSYGSAFQREISGIYLNRAQVDYQPSKNFKVSLQYRNLPANGYGSGYYRYPSIGGFGLFYDDGY